MSSHKGHLKYLLLIFARCSGEARKMFRSDSREVVLFAFAKKTPSDLEGESNRHPNKLALKAQKKFHSEYSGPPVQMVEMQKYLGLPLKKKKKRSNFLLTDQTPNIS